MWFSSGATADERDLASTGTRMRFPWSFSSQKGCNWLWLRGGNIILRLPLASVDARRKTVLTRRAMATGGNAHGTEGACGKRHGMQRYAMQ